MRQRPLQSSPGRPVVSGDLRRGLGTFLAGVTVVTCVDELARPRGYCQGNHLSLGLADQAVERKKRARTVFFGCNVNDHDRVLFCRRAGEAGRILPSTSLIADGDAVKRTPG